MQKPKLGEFCAGYGGLAKAIEEVFDAELAWYSEFDPAPSKIMAHHWPDAPNLGDMTLIDYHAAPRVKIMGGGTPCQDLSHAGKRAGMTEGTRSNLWVQMREAIAIQQPTYVVWENVRGAYSAEADSSLEQCPGCLGDASDRGTVLRALGRVLGDLSDLGFDTEWRGLRAADVGACHSRYRVFVLAAHPGRVRRDQALKHDGRRTPAYARAGVPDESGRLADGLGPIRETFADRDHVGDDRAGEWAEQNRRGQLADSGRVTAQPASLGRREGRAEHARLEGRPDAIERRASTDWGDYAAAVARWESVMGRRAPAPTEPTGRDGGQRLSPRFTEWMMGLPDGWVTDPAIGITRNDQLKACGNGVVPQQAFAALRDMLGAFAAADADAERSALSAA